MSNIKEHVVNCYADMEMVSFLLDIIPDYENVLIPRHHKFVDSYIKYKKSLKMVSVTHGFSELDIKRIFWRIQRKLLLEFIERAGKGQIIVTDIPKNFDEFLMWQLEQFRDDSESVFIYVKSKIHRGFNIDGVSEKRKEQIELVLNTLGMYKDLENILPKNVYPIARDLLSGMSLTSVVTKYEKNFNYLVTSIIGRKNYRSVAERGWLGYLENIVEENNVIRFPLR